MGMRKAWVSTLVVEVTDISKHGLGLVLDERQKPSSTN
jgi:hypothetical protein